MTSGELDNRRHQRPMQSNRFTGFAVRLWMEEVASGTELRGSVEDVVSDARRGFRDWSDMIAFMLAGLAERELPTTPDKDTDARQEQQPRGASDV